MNETTNAVALSTPSNRGHLIAPGVWRMANGEEVALGGRISRLFARGADMASFGAVVFLASGLASWLSAGPTSFFIISSLFIGLYLIGQSIGLAVWGRTFGKLCFGLKVIHTAGAPVSLVRGILLRESIRYAAIASGLMDLISLALIFRDDRRMLHDLVSDTVVIYQSVEWPAGWAA
ncbi:MAG: RDD family protein [Myxococcota bacterium]